MKKPYTITSARPLSWSAISSFEYSPSSWHRRYVLNEKDEPSKEMLFGKLVGERLATEPTFLPHVPRLSLFEYELRAELGKIPLIGFIDSYEPHSSLLEFKTGRKIWDQKRADSHGQLDMYLLMLYLRDKVKPEGVECSLVWLPTQSEDGEISFVDEHDVKIFDTKRTMVDILRFGQRINDTYKQMQDYANSHP